jgi:hypothetical protein
MTVFVHLEREDLFERLYEENGQGRFGARKVQTSFIVDVSHTKCWSETTHFPGRIGGFFVHSQTKLRRHERFVPLHRFLPILGHQYFAPEFDFPVPCGS